MADRPARVDDVHQIAASMPHVTRLEGPKGNSIYQVGGKSFVFFRTPQPDAIDPVTGERYADVIMLWVESESDKLALVQDPGFTVLHHRPLRRASFGTGAGQSIGGNQQDRVDRADSGRVVVPGVEEASRGLARRPSVARR